jgi:hypothetical protein
MSAMTALVREYCLGVTAWALAWRAKFRGTLSPLLGQNVW